MKRIIFIVIAIVLIIFVALAGTKFLQIKTMIGFGKTFQMPPETVSSALAHEENWTETLSAIGSINAEQGVTVAPEIAGTVSEIDFESGANVNKGDLLLKMDTSSEDAQLRSLTAQSDLMKLTADRTRKLHTDGTASQSEVDQADANFKQADANADNIRAVIAKKTIRAPFTGQLGIRLVNLGEQIAVGKGIVSLQALSPVFADFTLPQQDLEKVSTGLATKVVSDTFPDKTFEGEVAAINPDLDAATRSVRLRAKIPNTDKFLRPGMFVRAQVVLPGDQKVLVIPATALLSAPYGDSVFVIDSKVDAGKTNLIVQQKFIRTGRTQGDFVSVQSGLNVGDKVVTAGLFKLRNGMAVVENNDIVPKSSDTPTPPNT
ncbi:MAG TPA: efflux RND transporter periplasmic adaptor subunit [Verrucomicrobiae bacterium]|nr:efflux RND transporter periplasmic adaptor subunit [Verrucomicrobiae bacterium]